MIHDTDTCDCEMCRWADEAERRRQREALADFVTCPHYDHQGVDCPMVQAHLERLKEGKDADAR